MSSALSESKVETLEFRVFQPEDRPAVEQLWEEEAGWGQLTSLHWTKFYEENPNGKGVVVLAVDGSSGRVVGQFVFVATRVSIKGKIVSACRAYAPIVGKQMRMFRYGGLGEHPMFQMYEFGLQVLRQRGVHLVYTLPDPKWVRLLRMLQGVNLGIFELWSLPLPLPSHFGVELDCDVKLLNDSAEDVATVWKEAARSHDVLIVRDSVAMSWRPGRPAAVIVRHAQTPIGMGSIHTDVRLGQCLILDLLAVDDHYNLSLTLQKLCNIAQESALAMIQGRPITKICLLAPPSTQPVLKDLGFRPDDYTFPFQVTSLNPEVSPADISPDRWYLTSKD